MDFVTRCEVKRYVIIFDVNIFWNDCFFFHCAWIVYCKLQFVMCWSAELWTKKNISSNNKMIFRQNRNVEIHWPMSIIGAVAINERLINGVIRGHNHCAAKQIGSNIVCTKFTRLPPGRIGLVDKIEFRRSNCVSQHT